MTSPIFSCGKMYFLSQNQAVSAISVLCTKCRLPISEGEEYTEIHLEGDEEPEQLPDNVICISPLANACEVTTENICFDCINRNTFSTHYIQLVPRTSPRSKLTVDCPLFHSGWSGTKEEFISLVVEFVYEWNCLHHPQAVFEWEEKTEPEEETPLPISFTREDGVTVEFLSVESFLAHTRFTP